MPMHVHSEHAQTHTHTHTRARAYLRRAKAGNCKDDDAAAKEESNGMVNNCKEAGEQKLCEHPQIGPLAQGLCPVTCNTCPAAAGNLAQWAHAHACTHAHTDTQIWELVECMCKYLVSWEVLISLD